MPISEFAAAVAVPPKAYQPNPSGSFFFNPINQMKFCIDCKHYIQSPGGLGLCAACPNPSVISSHYAEWLVHGKGQEPRHHDLYYCPNARGSETQCGVSARKFEPKGDVDTHPNDGRIHPGQTVSVVSGLPPFPDQVPV